MMAIIKATATRFRKSPISGWCGNIGDVLDCVIPIILVIAIIIGCALVAFGFVQ